MTRPTRILSTPEPATDLIDLSAARRLARGTAQQAWLAELITANGLRVADHLPRRWTVATYDRITAFLTRLWAAGYDLRHQPGPRGGRGTRFLRGYQPDQAARRRIITALGYDLAYENGDRWQPARLLAMLDAEDPATVQNTTDLLDLAGWVAWQGLPIHTPAPDALASILDACPLRPVLSQPPTTSAGGFSPNSSTAPVPVRLASPSNKLRSAPTGSPCAHRTEATPSGAHCSQLLTKRCGDQVPNALTWQGPQPRRRLAMTLSRGCARTPHRAHHPSATTSA